MSPSEDGEKGSGVDPSTDDDFRDFVRARSPALLGTGQLDRILYGLGGRSGLIVVLPKGATRAEIQLAGGAVQQVPLRYGGAFVVPDGKPLKVPVFDKDGTWWPSRCRTRASCGRSRAHGHRRSVPVNELVASTR